MTYLNIINQQCLFAICHSINIDNLAAQVPKIECVLALHGTLSFTKLSMSFSSSLAFSVSTSLKLNTLYEIATVEIR